MINIKDKILIPNWLRYPESYLRLISESKDEFLPWYLTDEEDCDWRIKGLTKRYKSRNLFPFARKDGCDDIACWEKGQGDKVFVIHDFASSGWEQREIFDNFDQWYEWALQQDYD